MVNMDDWRVSKTKLRPGGSEEVFCMDTGMEVKMAIEAIGQGHNHCVFWVNGDRVGALLLTDDETTAFKELLRAEVEP